MENTMKFLNDIVVGKLHFIVLCMTSPDKKVFQYIILYAKMFLFTKVYSN